VYRKLAYKSHRSISVANRRHQHSAFASYNCRTTCRNVIKFGTPPTRCHTNSILSPAKRRTPVQLDVANRNVSQSVGYWRRTWRVWHEWHSNACMIHAATRICVSLRNYNGWNDPNDVVTKITPTYTLWSYNPSTGPHPQAIQSTLPQTYISVRIYGVLYLSKWSVTVRLTHLGA
jgi:hypothetical protein